MRTHLRIGAPPWEVKGEMRSFAEIPSRTTETFEDDVEWEIGRLKAAGIDQVLAIELTKEEFGLPVGSRGDSGTGKRR